MKKFLRTISAAILVAVTAIMFVSCGIPSDPAKAQSNLEKNGYTVDTTVAATIVTATVIYDGGASASGNVSNVIYASNDDGESVLLVYFKDTSTAKDYLGKIKDWYKKATEDNKDEEQKDSDTQSGRSGKVLYIGTKAAVKAVK